MAKRSLLSERLTYKEYRQFCLITPVGLTYPPPTDRMVQVADANNEQSATTKRGITFVRNENYVGL